MKAQLEQYRLYLMDRIKREEEMMRESDYRDSTVLCDLEHELDRIEEILNRGSE